MKGKRWKKILLFAGGSLFGVVLLLLVLGPLFIASVARSRILAWLSERTDATGTVGSVSFHWPGHLELRDVRLVPRNFSAPLLEAMKVDVRVDAGSAIGGRPRVVVDLDSSKILVEKGADGRFNCEFPSKAFFRRSSPRESGGKAAKDSRTPSFQATLLIREGIVTFREKDHDAVYPHVTVRAAVDAVQNPVTFSLSLEDLQRERLQAEGALDLGPAGQKPRSRITIAATGVRLTGQMSPILERLSPIFHTSGAGAKVDGVLQSEIRLEWTGPMGAGEKDWLSAAAASLSGSARIDVQNLDIRGSPTVGQILSAMGLSNALEGELVSTQIQIGGGQCSYENMTLRGSPRSSEALERARQELSRQKEDLEGGREEMSGREYRSRRDELRQKEEDLPYRYVLRFGGVVRFDKTMDLRVRMPISDGMAKAHPRLENYIGSSFWVDLTGTTDRPRLDTRKMLAELARRAAEGLMKEKLGGALSGLLGIGKKREKEAESLWTAAQEADGAGAGPAALKDYERLADEYGDTDFVKKRRAAVQERLQALRGR